ncbi:YncE family protein [Priestia megaterium]|uniref:YncE family protein n=1 Tax=Priestia megaterium TaxID=1404 RepID=A0A6M6E3U5_PRIMG|nr:YncE family protein [Priestia megaterium]QJX80356.1 hypothetical protein FDZ14_30175 [Priestia megaterium]
MGYLRIKVSVLKRKLRKRTTNSTSSLPTKIFFPNFSSAKVFVTNRDSQNISVVNANTNTLIENIPNPNGPHRPLFGIAALKGTRKVYVCSDRSDGDTERGGLFVIDAVTNKVIKMFEGIVGNFSSVATNPITKLVYVYSDFRLVIIDGNTDTIINTIPISINLVNALEVGPNAIAVNSKTNKIYLTGPTKSAAILPLTNYLIVLDGATNNKITQFSLNQGPAGPASGLEFPSYISINENTNKIYIANNFLGTLSIINGDNDSLITTLNLGNRAFSVAVNVNTNKIYVGCRAIVNNSFVSGYFVIDGNSNTIINFVRTGVGAVNAMIADPKSNRVYAADTFGTFYVISGDNDQIIKRITIGFGSVSMTYTDPFSNQ